MGSVHVSKCGPGLDGGVLNTESGPKRGDPHPVVPTAADRKEVPGVSALQPVTAQLGRESDRGDGGSGGPVRRSNRTIPASAEHNGGPRKRQHTWDWVERQSRANGRTGEWGWEMTPRTEVRQQGQTSVTHAADWKLPVGEKSPVSGGGQMSHQKNREPRHRVQRAGNMRHYPEGQS